MADKDIASPPARSRSRHRFRIAAAALVLLSGVLAVNAIVVSRHSAGASGGSVLHVAGHDLNVRQNGPAEAPAIVLLHGFGGSTRWWDPVVPTLSTAHHVIRVDLLGFGRSAKPAGGGYEIPEQAHTVAAVLDRLGLKGAVVVGHSTGGSVATALVEQRPDLVSGIALIDSGPRLSADTSQGPADTLLGTPGVGQMLWRLRTDGLIRRSLSTGFSRRGFEIPQELVDDVRDVTFHAYSATVKAATAYLAERPLPDRLKGAGKPVLVIFGKEDKRWEPSSAMDYEVVPGARVVMLPAVGHSAMQEDPPRTARLLLGFSESVVARPGGPAEGPGS